MKQLTLLKRLLFSGVFVVLFFAYVSPTSAIAEQHATYQQAEKQFLLDKSQYEQYGTILSLETLISSSKAAQLARIRVIKQYFSEINEELSKFNSKETVQRVIDSNTSFTATLSSAEEKITSAEDVFNRFKDRLGQEKQEHFIVLYLDSKHQILKEETISIGTLDASLVHPREVFKRAIQESAYGIILVHNHPSGDPTPSDEDKEITEKLVECGEILGIKVLDHVIVGRDKYWNYKENNK